MTNACMLFPFLLPLPYSVVQKPRDRTINKDYRESYFFGGEGGNSFCEM